MRALRPTLAAAALALAGAARAADPAGFPAWLLEQGFPAEAARELERLHLAGVDDAALADAAVAVGTRLAREDRPADAARALALAADGAADPAVADERRLALAAVLYRARAWAQGADVLSRVEAFGATEDVRGRARRLLCAGQILALELEAARTCAAHAGAGPEAARLLDRMSVDPGRRALVGGALSLVVPGLGQVTAGEPVNGSLALLLNAGWVTGATLLALDALYVDAALVTVGFGSRYYIGNVKHGAAAWRARAERGREAAARELAGRVVAAEP